MKQRRIFVRYTGSGCSHCRKKISQMRTTHRGDDEQFVYRCLFCRTLWGREMRFYLSVEETDALLFLSK